MRKTVTAIVFTIYILVLFNNVGFAQQWINTFDGNAHRDDQVLASVSDIRGNVYVTGFATRIGSDMDFCTIKYNSAGITQWISYYDGPAHGEDKSFGIVADNSGHYIYVTGYSTTQGNNKDFTTIKYDAATGAQLFINRFGDPANEEDKAFGISIDNFNNVYVTGYITKSGLNKDIYTVKYNPNLVFIWQKTFNGSGNSDDRSFGIVTDNSGLRIYITGYVTDDSNGKDIITVCYDSSGSLKWNKIYNGTGNEDDQAFGIAIDSYMQGGIYVTGYSTNSSSSTDYTTIKYNAATGTVKWVSKYNGPDHSDDYAFGIVVDNNGNSFVTGISTGVMRTGGSFDYLTIRYNNNGDTVWTARYNGGGNADDSATAVVLSPSGEFLYVSGSSIGDSPVNNQEIATIKYDALTGRQVQLARISLPNNEKEVCSKLVVDGENNLFIAGYAKNTANGRDFITAKYLRGELIKVVNISSNVPSHFKLYQNYPNPFNPSTTIRFSVPASGKGSRAVFVNVSVFDVLGNKVTTLVSEELSPGIYETAWNASGVSSGIYFYTLNTTEYSAAQRMILIK